MHPQPTNKIPLRRRGIFNLFLLMPGDRFYFFNDATKTVWQVKQRIIKKGWNGQLQKFAICTNDKQQQQTFSSHRSIVYLRTANPQ